ncbi:lytic transglycosylase domain-containing protein [Streptomyces fagopyri]|uniref:Lytic transglycosylase domain-containing protein n=1 Tax=Streptomyces fagopyri TaxID=2662397 RepID=A0A5Q0L513_9ACTN|nr:lytic transglycosylase domain-containing protein [Streptomyces fagopyri]QFZ71914.1 lytic transglycosylase domain-containing protein [Streptomyces fagopyri]
MGAKESEGGAGSNAVMYGVAGAGVGGCVMIPIAVAGAVPLIIIFGGLGVLFAPLIALILLFGGGGGSADDYSSANDTANQMVGVLQGDGKGELDTATVPTDLVDPIQKAGEQCDAIGPIVIASQLEKASGFNSTLVGPHGETGISQLTPDIFSKYGKDDDGNGTTQATDNKDSIMALSRYMCDLASQGQTLLDNGTVVKTTDRNGNTTNSVLDLSLAGYAIGMDAVKAAKGVPQSNDALSYVLAIRAQFAKYQGIAAPPSGATPGVTPTTAPTDTN